MWYIGTAKIIVTQMQSDNKQIIARLQPLNGATIKQVFGYEAKVVKVRGYVVGDTNLGLIQGYTTDGTTHALMENAENHGSFLVNSIGASRLNILCQTIDPSEDLYERTYEVDVELYL
jgi:hypothetical protein